jgi:hypothetical protein
MSSTALCTLLLCATLGDILSIASSNSAITTLITPAMR